MLPSSSSHLSARVSSGPQFGSFGRARYKCLKQSPRGRRPAAPAVEAVILAVIAAVMKPSGDHERRGQLLPLRLSLRIRDGALLVEADTTVFAHSKTGSGALSVVQGQLLVQVHGNAFATASHAQP